MKCTLLHELAVRNVQDLQCDHLSRCLSRILDEERRPVGLLRQALPLLQHYRELAQWSLWQLAFVHRTVSKMLSLALIIFSNLASKVSHFGLLAGRLYSGYTV